MNKILNKVRQIITGNKECNYGFINKKEVKEAPKEDKPNNSALNANKKFTNKVGRNKWGFPTFTRKRK